MLSTKFGYGLPAFLAAAFAAAFFFGESGLLLPKSFGLGFSHTGLVAIIMRIDEVCIGWINTTQLHHQLGFE